MDWKYFDHTVKGCLSVTSPEGHGCYYDFVPYFVIAYGFLPVECRQCHKALIFWDYSRSNIVRFKKMLASFPLSVSGKYNESVVVFYTGSKEKLLTLLGALEVWLNQYGVEGRIQWRVSGKYWERDYPSFFKSAKELYPVPADVSIKQWLEDAKRVGDDAASEIERLLWEERIDRGSEEAAAEEEWEHPERVKLSTRQKMDRVKRRAEAHRGTVWR